MKIRRSQLEMTIMLAFENEKMTMHKCVNRMKKNAIRKTNERNERKRMEHKIENLENIFISKCQLHFMRSIFGGEHTHYTVQPKTNAFSWKNCNSFTLNFLKEWSLEHRKCL